MYYTLEGAVYMFTVTMFLLYTKMPVVAMILYLAVQSINIQYNTLQWKTANFVVTPLCICSYEY